MELEEQIIPIVTLAELLAISDDNVWDMRKQHLLISRYKHERSTNKDYNGRQLLELIQNADDAGSPYIEIIMDTSARLLRIVNSGAPFSIDGFRSLMIPNLSSKIKKHYIGNKGLGFRSVVNWSEEVTVYSAGVRVRFSREATRNQFNEWYSPAEQAAIRSQYGYNATVVPVPIFAVPEIIKQDEYPGKTVIDIRYFESVIDDIEKQFADLRPEILLFLNHISEIKITVNGACTIYKANKSGNVTTIGEHSWTIYDNKINGSDPELPPKYKDTDSIEIEYYSLKVARQPDLSDRVNRLYSFFPTKISMNLPVVVHGTFELDSSRNRIIVSDKNKFLADELLQLLFRVALQDGSGWDRFRLLNYNRNEDVDLKEMGFYLQIDQFLRTAAVLPCLDGTFRTYAAVNILPQSFTAQVIVLKRNENFPELLQEIPSDIKDYFDRLFPYAINNQRYRPPVLKSRLEAAGRILANSVPALIYARWIAEIKKLYVAKAPEMLEILYDDQEEKKIADSTVSLFTPSRSSGITIPKHVKIEYLNRELYDSLVTVFNINDPQPSRRLKEELANFADIQSFEPVPVLQKIISETKTTLEDPSDKAVKKDKTKEMIRSLYGYYSQSDKAKNTVLRLSGIPVINAMGEIVTARNTFLSPAYAAGRLRQRLLGDLYPAEQQIASPAELGIAESSDTENFLVDFMGVNRFVEIDLYENSTKYDRLFNEFVFALKSRPERFRDARITASYIRNESQLKTAIASGMLPYENFIAWICLDQEVRELAESPLDTRFEYAQSGQNAGTWPHALQVPPTFIRYQLSAIGGFNDFVLDTDNIDYLNAIPFDQNAACFRDNGISADRVREVLKLAGAKNEFAELNLKRIRDILSIMPGKDPLGKHARKIYHLCANRFKQKPEPLIDKAGLMLHGTADNQKRYEAWEKVYYTRTISLPARITAGKTLLNFPKRGAENNITGFFGVKTFDDINFISGDYQIDTEATRVLSRHLRHIRPFILLERWSSLQKGGEKKEAVRTVKSLEILLCRQLSYSLGGELREADHYDFVSSATDKNTWLVRYTGPFGYEALTKDSRLSDVISEIWSIAFDLSNITDAVSFIYREDTGHTRRRMLLEYGEEELADAESRLEVSDAERDFCRAIFRLTENISLLPEADDEGDFRKLVAGTLGINPTILAGIDFGDLLYPGNLRNLQLLFNHLQVTIPAFNESMDTRVSFYELHLEKFMNLISNCKPQLTAAYWMQCSKSTRAQQINFISNLSSIVHELAEPLARTYYETVDPDYTGSLNDAINLRFPEMPENDDLFRQQYEENLKKLDTNSIAVNNLQKSDLSLLYFPVGDDDLLRISELLHPLKPVPAIGDTGLDSDETVPEVTDLEEAPEGADRTPPGADRKGKGYHGGGGGYGSSLDSIKQALGLKAEKMVLKTMKGKEYQWLSGYSNSPAKNDQIGYDICFKEKPGDDWSYIEVKWFASGIFRLPDTEFNFARDHADRYYIYLVTDDTIKKVLFGKLIDDNSEFKRDNDYFSYAVSEYKFKLL
jgi:hypothetical protein